MATVRAGKVKYLAGDYSRGKWEECEMSLSSDAVITLNYAGTQQNVNIGLLGAAVPLDSVPCGFIIKNEEESAEYSQAPIFKTDTEEESRQWMISISEVILKQKIATRHPHPLPQEGVFNGGNLGLKCTTCGCAYAYVIYHSCEYCNDYTLCSTCYNSLYKFPRYPVVTSATHPHPLVRPELVDTSFALTSNTIVKPECSRCHANCTGYHYVCSQCPGYFECSTCAYELIHNSEPNAAKEMRLDIGNLEHVVHSPVPNTYTIDAVGKRCPDAMSMISQQHWDLSRIDIEPVPHAYFEVTFKKISGAVGVGIGNQTFVQNRMLGQQQNSYGYLSDGKLLVSNNPNADGIEFPSINEGDTIGAGILLDSYNLRRLYFTKNGKMLGCFPGRVHRGMDCFPGVSFSRQGAEFSVNMIGPFTFDVHSIPNYRNDKKDRLKEIPEELVSEMIVYASQPGWAVSLDPSATMPRPCHDFALECRLISKNFKKASDDNIVWRTLFRWCFQNAYHDVKVKSWKSLYKARYLTTRQTLLLASHPIENCEFEFQCPILWEKLATTANDAERYCNKCSKTVYEVSDRETLSRYAKMGRCVSLIVRKSGDDYNEFIERLGGEAPQQPRHIPYEFSSSELTSFLQ